MKGGDYESCNTKEIKNEHKEETKADEETEEEQEAPVLLVTYVEIFLHSIFSNNEVYNNN